MMIIENIILEKKIKSKLSFICLIHSNIEIIRTKIREEIRKMNLKILVFVFFQVLAKNVLISANKIEFRINIYHDNTFKDVNEIVSHVIKLMNRDFKRTETFRLDYSIHDVNSNNQAYQLGQTCISLDFYLFFYDYRKAKNL